MSRQQNTQDSVMVYSTGTQAYILISMSIKSSIKEVNPYIEFQITCISLKFSANQTRSIGSFEINPGSLSQDLSTTFLNNSTHTINLRPLSNIINRPLEKMGFFDSWSDLVTAATPWSQVEAEAPTSGGASSTKTPASYGEGEGEAKVCTSCSLVHIIPSFLREKIH
jgi:hypothetical protein